jgi:energy-converting hydrogenase Eha subunit A
MDPFKPTPANPTKVATKWALIATATSIVLTFVYQFLNVAQDSPARYISILPSIAFIILAQIEYKEMLGGHITFGKAFSTGFRVGLFAGILGAVFMFIYVSYIYPEFIPQMMEAQKAKMAEKNMSDEQIEQAMRMTSKMMSPIWLSFFAAVGGAISGAIISLITAAIVKKDPPPFDGEAYVQPTDQTV